MGAQDRRIIPLLERLKQTMKVCIYAKSQDDFKVFTPVIYMFKEECEIYTVVENLRSFREFDRFEKNTEDTAYAISSLRSLGTNYVAIKKRLSWFVENDKLLFVCEIPTTFEHGMDKDINHAVLRTILQFVNNTPENVVSISTGKRNAGRKKLPYPDNWDELYQMWENKKISSKEFIEASGLKKATFYNVLSEYKANLSEKEELLRAANGEIEQGEGTFSD